MTSEDSGVRRRLGTALRRLRLDAGLSQESLGASLGWSQSKVAKIENGRTVPTVDDVRRWLARLGADAATTAELVQLADEVGTQATAWREVNRRGYGAQQRARAEREAETVGISIYQSEVVPGLLQTPEYARRVLEVHSQAPPDDIPAAVLARLDRQTILFDESKRIECIITETALRWRPGSVAVTLAQLDRIASLATLKNVTIGVVSREAQEVTKPLHSFVLLRYADASEVQVETLTAEVSITASEDVAAYERFLEHQRQHAVYGDELATLLARIAAELRGAASSE